MFDKRLTIIPSVPVWLSEEELVFDRKFFDGVLMFVQHWSGPITCVCHLATNSPPKVDTVRKKNHELPFCVQLVLHSETISDLHLKDTDLVMASADAHEQLHVSALCQRLRIPCVYVIEYIPETRYQIVEIETRNFFKRLRRNFFIWQTEKKREASFQLADGLQCNGVPAYEHYRHAPMKLLYFDTRTRQKNLISDAELSQRISYLEADHPLRLAFSGRLIGIKGADQLIRVAKGLRDRGVDFHFTIYGSGELQSRMQQEIMEEKLHDHINMAGSVDFETRLIPEIKAHVDLYVMLHRQSDPSCTYMETLGCGIPIVGYANKAFKGILKLANIGTGVSMDDINGIVSAIENLAANRDILVTQSWESVKYARQHSFEGTFQSRLKHLHEVMKK